MRVLLFLGCGVIAAACTSNKPAEEPTHVSEAPTTATNWAADPPVKPSTSDNRAPNGPSDAPQVPSADGRSHPQSESTTANAEFSTMGTPNPSPPPAAAPEGASRPDADNTRVNKRDRGAGTLTPMDQGNDRSDVTITQDIRKAVVADSSLSFTAKNVKIITQGGKVTLRGVVKSDQERKSIDDSARKVAGAGNVDDQLEVKK